jgi:hypothetical protein
MPESTDYLCGGKRMNEKWSFFFNVLLLLMQNDLIGYIFACWIGLVMAGIFALLPIIYRINSAVGSAVVDMLHPSSFRKALHSTNIICNILFGSSRW